MNGLLRTTLAASRSRVLIRGRHHPGQLLLSAAKPLSAESSVPSLSTLTAANLKGRGDALRNARSSLGVAACSGTMKESNNPSRPQLRTHAYLGSQNSSDVFLSHPSLQMRSLSSMTLQSSRHLFHGSRYSIPPPPPLSSLQNQHISFFSSVGTSQSDETKDQKPDPKKPSISANARTKVTTRKPYATTAKIPTPKTSSSKSGSTNGFDVQKLMSQATKVSLSALKAIFSFIINTPSTAWYYLSHPAERAKKVAEIKELAQKEFDHYWMGTKLLMADVRTARRLLAKTLGGSPLTRRERKQMLRTVSDLFRIVPFSMFILIPFMEFALPFALRIFPNMLPSTFQDSLKAEETMKRELQSRIAMAQFFQETLEELAKEQKQIAQKRKEKAMPGKEQDGCDEEASIASKQEESAASMLEFLERARSGEALSSDAIVQYATYFQDDLTLSNMPRMQLINMCKYMSIPPYGSDTFLQLQLRHKIRSLKEDDQRILWEGIKSLTKMELREACQERGMRSTGMSKDSYRSALQQWLDLSVNKNVPIALLIMSRIFYLQEELVMSSADSSDKTVGAIVDAISGLDKDVVNEVVLEVATSEEKKSDPNVQKIKLEVVTHQNEKIRQEQAEREAAAKKKETAEKSDSTAAIVSEGAPAVEEIADSSSANTDVEPAASSSDSAAAGTDPSGTSSTVTATADAESTAMVSDKVTESDQYDDHDLSSQEMDALSQLLTPDPVSKEKADLERLKSAIQDDKQDKISSDAEAIEEVADDTTVPSATAERVDANEAELQQQQQQQQKSESDQIADSQFDDTAVAAAKITEADEAAKAEAEASTTFTTDAHLRDASNAGDTLAAGDAQVVPQAEDDVDTALVDDEVEEEEDVVVDPVVDRLRQRIESMVDKIEVQLSAVKIKIGDKLHFLDKDMDGILSREEMADCLQQVLKREITLEEAMEIAAEMDENKDGLFTVGELIQWIETNKLVQFVKEGRDAEMEEIIVSHEKDKDDDNNKMDVLEDTTAKSSSKSK